MIIGDNRRAVIENIKNCAENEDFHSKVELTDPVLSDDESRAITDKYMLSRHKVSFRIKTAVGVMLAKTASKYINKNTVIEGLDSVPKDLGGVIITSNHFSPLENTVIRYLVTKLHRKKLGIISQVTNFAMTGALGFLMNYADTIPISLRPHYLANDLMTVLNERLVEKKDAVLLYPEQEMWFNYRKPRPPKNGAYLFAAKLNVPILSCFVEMIDMADDDTEEFRQVRYVLHVLGLLYPDPQKSLRENINYLSSEDYRLKKECYESCYGKPLTYQFENTDIAGWKNAQ